jgi:hypothetical protein
MISLEIEIIRISVEESKLSDDDYLSNRRNLNHGILDETSCDALNLAYTTLIYTLLF